MSLTQTRSISSTRTVAVGLLAVVASLLLAAPAVAQSGGPVDAQYDDSVTQTEDASSGGSDSDAGLEKNIVSGLPITGLDVLALAAVAIVLTAMGFALRFLTGTVD